MDTTTTTQTAIETLAADPTLAGCTWDERGITPIRDPSAAPLPLSSCGIFRCPVKSCGSDKERAWKV